MTTLVADLLRTDGAMDALASDWLALWSRTRGANPFQSPLWLLTWWRYFGTGQLRVGVLRNADRELLGVLPMYVLRYSERCQLLPLGAGISDYFDALLDPQAPQDAGDLLLRTVLNGTIDDRPDTCDLLELPPGAQLLATSPPTGWCDAASWNSPSPVLAVGRDLKSTVPSAQRRKLRMARHRAARMGGWVVSAADTECAGQFLDALIELHRMCWAERGRADGVFADRSVVAFHTAVAPPLVRAGLLRLYLLRLAGRAAAACYVLDDGHGRLMLYLSGYDPGSAYASPGTLLLGHIVEAGIADGVEEVHFLRGGEAYKYAWGAQDRANTSRTLQRERG